VFWIEMADFGHRPPGMSQSEFGLKLWGEGPDDARCRWRDISHAELTAMKIDCEMIVYWRDQYRDFYVRRQGGESARPRWRLLNKCAKLLDCD
jgi:hypothetical protein